MQAMHSCLGFLGEHTAIYLNLAIRPAELGLSRFLAAVGLCLAIALSPKVWLSSLSSMALSPARSPRSELSTSTPSLPLALAASELTELTLSGPRAQDGGANTAGKDRVCSERSSSPCTNLSLMLPKNPQKEWQDYNFVVGSRHVQLQGRAIDQLDEALH